LRGIAVAAALVVGILPLATQPFGAASSESKSSDGAHPRGGLVLADNVLYGTTAGGAAGFWGCGTVFKVNTRGKGFAVLHGFMPLSPSAPFTNSDGAFPHAGLLLSGHTLYGTTPEGGAAACGTIFKVSMDGTGFAVLHSFAGNEGARPMSRLVLSGKTLYGTTQRGGNNQGTVFKVNMDGTGFATLHAFSGLSGRDLTNWDGAFPETELLVSGSALYGTAWAGGAGGRGTVFKLDTEGGGFTVLHNFTAGHCNENGRTSNTDGAYPQAGLVLLGDTLFGTASAGGEAGSGTVFKLQTDGGNFSVLHSFTAHGLSYPDNTNGDGEGPNGLALSGKTLYGIASDRGKGFWGTLFKVNTDRTGFDVIHSFSGTGGASPQGSLALFGDVLYGVANFGGGRGGGTVFKVRTNGTKFVVLHRFTAAPLPPWATD
jgi:uncharacterized repeat protein (TIGR03803 family)